MKGNYVLYWENMEIGVDSSKSMIKMAQEQYPGIEFMVCDALALSFNRQFDFVFSNADMV